MKIAVGIPVFNEINFIDQSVQDALVMNYDAVVYLDDGSTDGTYESLVNYAKLYDNIYVIRNESNSIVNKGQNRWQKVTEFCRQFEPDWIMVRAADQVFSYKARTLLRKRLIDIYNNTQVTMVAFPVVHFWRSPYWIRVDNSWGHSAYNHVSASCWRNDSGWEFINDYTTSGMHKGAHRPNKFDVPYKVIGINSQEVGKPLPISVLHYGMSSNKLIADKLDFQMSIADKIGGGVGLPTTKSMPHPMIWNKCNGYKVGHELNMKIVKAHDIWYEKPLGNIPPPKFESLYKIIVKYNRKRAEEYAVMYGK